MDNATYWNEYEKQTGLKRPAWIDGVGNVNYEFNKPDPLPAKTLKAAQTAGMMPQVRALPPAQDLMPQAPPIRAWQPGVRGWRPGW